MCTRSRCQPGCGDRPSLRTSMCCSVPRSGSISSKMSHLPASKASADDCSESSVTASRAPCREMLMRSAVPAPASQIKRRLTMPQHMGTTRFLMRSSTVRRRRPQTAHVVIHFSGQFEACTTSCKGPADVAWCNGCALYSCSMSQCTPGRELTLAITCPNGHSVLFGRRVCATRGIQVRQLRLIRALDRPAEPEGHWAGSRQH
jgi:hypothetical protein